MFTERIVPGGETRAEADDSVGRQIEGLGCRVFPSGHKAYVLSYRTGQRKHLATIGRVRS